MQDRSFNVTRFQRFEGGRRDACSRAGCISVTGDGQVLPGRPATRHLSSPSRSGTPLAGGPAGHGEPRRLSLVTIRLGAALRGFLGCAAPLAAQCVRPHCAWGCVVREAAQFAPEERIRSRARDAHRGRRGGRGPLRIGLSAPALRAPGPWWIEPAPRPDSNGSTCFDHRRFLGWSQRSIPGPINGSKRARPHSVTPRAGRGPPSLAAREPSSLTDSNGDEAEPYRGGNHVR